MAEKIRWLPPLLARLSLGIVFIQSGWRKFHNLQNVIGFFTELKIPMPQLQAPLVATIELCCGLLILIGLYTQWAALPLIGTMFVAILTAKLGTLKEFSDLFELEEFLFIVLLLWLAISGPGRMAADSILVKGRSKKRK